MKFACTAVPISILALTTACSEPAYDTAAETTAEAETLAAADMTDSEGAEVGRVQLMRSSNSLYLDVALAELEPGTKAIHLHTTGDCQAPDFSSAGGHLNPTGATHGSLSQTGKHLGDLPNIEVSEPGDLAQTIELAGEADNILSAIFDQDGTAIVIHAGPDDYLSDPAGAAGPRIACGVLQQKR